MQKRLHLCATTRQARRTFRPKVSELGDPDARFAEEVADLHRFFEDWFHGSTDRRIEEFADRLDAQFIIVGPNGQAHGREDIVRLVEERFGSYNVAISTSDASVAAAEPVIVGSYREHQEFQGDTTHRVATVVMVQDDSIGTGMRWLSVHETWITDQA